jgi:hypothetical protein
MTALDLDLAPQRLAICRWPADQALPDWVSRGPFFSVTRTASELSAVCCEEAVPAGTACEGPWRLFAVRGPLDFALVGVLASLAAPLANANVSIFVVSSFDTDHVLVRAADVERAVQALRSAGHRVFGA